MCELPSSSPGRSRETGLLFLTVGRSPGGKVLWGEAVLHLPTSLSESGTAFAETVVVLQLLYGLLQTEFVHELLLSWYVCGENNGPRSPTL